MNNDEKIKHLLNSQLQLQSLVNTYLRRLKQYQVLLRIDRRHYHKLKECLLPWADNQIVAEILQDCLADYKQFYATDRAALITKLQKLATDNIDFLAQVNINQIIILPPFPDNQPLLKQIHQVRKRNMYVKDIPEAQSVYQALKNLRRVVSTKTGYSAVRNTWVSYGAAINDLRTFYNQNYT